MLKILVILSIPVLLSSCSTTYNLDPHIGVYKIEEAQCEVAEEAVKHCHENRFIELKKGTFHQIETNELALVFWRAGDPSSNELDYTVFPIKNHTTLSVNGKQVFLTNSKQSNASKALEEKQYFTLNKEVLSEYHFFFLKKDTKTGNQFSRKTRYKLKPAKPQDIAKFIFYYPEDLEE